MEYFSTGKMLLLIKETLSLVSNKYFRFGATRIPPNIKVLYLYFHALIQQTATSLKKNVETACIYSMWTASSARKLEVETRNNGFYLGFREALETVTDIT
jgi:hypothetical protein